MPRPISRCDLPVPLSPSSTTGSPRSTHSQLSSEASSAGSMVGGRLEVEVGEVLEPREARLVDAALAAARVAVVELGLEQLGEVGEVAEAVAQRGLGERAGLLAHGREAQRPAGRFDGQRRRLLADGRAHRALPASSAS